MIEKLEERLTLAFSVALFNTAINFNGSDGDDAVQVAVTSNGLIRHSIELTGNLVSPIDMDSTIAGEQSILASSVTSIRVDCGNGNDTIDASAWTGSGLAISGGAGNDTIKGGAGNDDLRGDEGDILSTVELVATVFKGLEGLICY